MSADHESFIKTPKQLITVVVLSFVLPVLLIALLVKFVGTGKLIGAGADAMSEAATLERIKPVAGFQLGRPEGGQEVVAARPVAAPAAAAAPKSGEQVFNQACMACHSTGAAGAPKVGDNAAWAPRIAQGLETLVGAAVKGKGAMPPQGAAFSETEVARAVVYMTNQSGGSFEEPK
ncbi:MAG: c-type cytochrome [Burkholderiaceae bacterium]